MNRNDRLVCTWPECGKTYGKASKLREHLRSHTNTRPFKCDRCDKSFLRNGHLRRHLTTTHSMDPKPFVCPVLGCGKAFSLKHHLKRHERIHEDPKPFLCSEKGCLAGFSRKEQLKRHQANVHGNLAMKVRKTYVCGADKCSLSFDRWSLVMKHRNNDHQNAAKYVCSECQKNFAKARYLKHHFDRVHARIHAEMALLCTWEECNKTFSSRNALKVHVATVHRKVKPYTCEQCGRSFGHKHLVVRHRRTHSKEEQPNADLSFDEPKASILDRLMGTEYVNERPHECLVISCRQRFYRDYDLKRHMESCHPISLPESTMETFVHNHQPTVTVSS